MRWYLNDASLQGQFSDRSEFERVLRGLIDARIRIPAIRQSLRLTRSLPEAAVAPETNVRRALFELRDKDLRAAIFSWLDRAGPFVDDDRLDEVDDYFPMGIGMSKSPRLDWVRLRDGRRLGSSAPPTASLEGRSTSQSAHSRSIMVCQRSVTAVTP